MPPFSTHTIRSKSVSPILVGPRDTAKPLKATSHEREELTLRVRRVSLTTPVRSDGSPINNEVYALGSPLFSADGDSCILPGFGMESL